MKNKGLLKYVVIIGLLILILLAKPLFLNSDDNKKATRIKNQIKVVEESVVDHILENNYQVPGENLVSYDDTIREAMEKGKLYNSLGLLKNDFERIEKNSYYLLDEEFINNNIDASLEGIFLSTNNGDILYIEKTR